MTTGSTRRFSGSLRLRAISAAKRRKVPSGRPPARPTVQLLILATVPPSPLSRPPWARAAACASVLVATCATVLGLSGCAEPSPSKQCRAAAISANACPNRMRIVRSLDLQHHMPFHQVMSPQPRANRSEADRNSGLPTAHAALVSSGHPLRPSLAGSSATNRCTSDASPHRRTCRPCARGGFAAGIGNSSGKLTLSPR